MFGFISKIIPTKWIIGIGVLALIILIGSAATYFFWSQSKISSLTTNVTTLSDENKSLKVSNESLNNNIKNLIELSKKDTARLENLDSQLSTERSHSKNLELLLRKHNLSDLAQHKPGLIEKRVNTATKNAINDLEKISRE